jgi:hypothetical protein
MLRGLLAVLPDLELKALDMAAVSPPDWDRMLEPARRFSRSVAAKCAMELGGTAFDRMKRHPWRPWRWALAKRPGLG